ncbi:MAG: diaminopimelate epimerase [Rhodospirillales bacterium]|nr:diaminopimelate epimerase [Rhodospirillales bacterium]
MDAVPFIKMHGLGNDFVVVDARERPFAPNAGQARAIADRRRGIGCDQVIVIEPPRNGLADVAMRIFNADGHEVAACGNGARCVAALVMGGSGADHAVIETAAGLLDAETTEGGLIAVDMGRVSFDWRDIPLAEAADTLSLAVAAGPLHDPVAVSVGNPHAVFFVDDAASITLDAYGPMIERHPLFPERTNVEVVQVLAPDRLRLRVWERGAGITEACGSGACAAVAAAHRRGFTGREVDVVLDGGTLSIRLLRDDHVLMTGPAVVSFTGAFDPAALTAAAS